MKKKYLEWSKEDLISELEKLNKRKKYGLVWEENAEDVVIQCKEEIPILTDDKNKEIISDDNLASNLIIEGDNYHSLCVLNYTHKEKIDIIYIDPPFNTGASDWKYNNKYVDENDQWRHSKWISFMNHRLKLAKNLLSKNGVIIIAIDDNELGSLSLLLDEIFPEKIKNTVTIIHNPHGVSGGGFSRCHEYAIFLLNRNQIINKKKVAEDLRTINLRRSGNNSLRSDSPTMFYPIYVDKKKFKIIKVGEKPKDNFHPGKQVIEKNNLYELWPIDDKGIEKNWYYSSKRVAEKGNEELFVKKVKNQINPYFKFSNNGQQTYKSVWVDKLYDAGAYGSTLIKRITGKNFPFPKSIYTVMDCLRAVINKENSIILDFFAGSGTTGDAVLQLNKEDKTNHKFILCTNNENNISQEITYERIKRIINGYTDTNSKNKISGIKENLKYFKTNFFKGPVTDKNKNLLSKKITEIICMKEETFKKVSISSNYAIFNSKIKNTIIVYNSEAIDEIKQKLKRMSGIKKIFIFSFGNDLFEEEFKNFKDVSIEPLPFAFLSSHEKITK